MVIFVFRASFSALCSLNVLMRQRLTFFKGLFVYTLTSLAFAIFSSCVTAGFYVHVLTPLVFFQWRFGPFLGHGLPDVLPANFFLTF